MTLLAILITAVCLVSAALVALGDLMAEATPRGRDESAIAHLQRAQGKIDAFELIAYFARPVDIEIFADAIRRDINKALEQLRDLSDDGK